MRGVDRVSPDGAVATIAGRQHGAVSWRQMRWAGLGSDAIAYRAENGRIHSVHRGVYLVGHVAAPPLGRDFAAVLACGEAALLSNESAAALWGFGPPSSLSHVLVVGRDPGRRAGIGVHRARRIDSADVRSRERVPVTSPARTLLDVAGGDGSGAGRLHAALGDDGRPRPTRSEAERMLLSLVRRAGISPDDTNIEVIPRIEAECLWRAAALVVEVDGFGTHGTREAFERDRRRDARLTAAGFRAAALARP